VSEATLRRIRAACVVVGLEAAAALAFGVAELAQLDRARLTVGLTTAAFFFVYAGGLAAAARGLTRLRAWSRAPVVLAQLIQLGVAWSFYGGSTIWVTVLLAGSALAVLAVVLAPATTDALYGRQDADDERPRSAS
jgi:hypothetical protein